MVRKDQLAGEGAFVFGFDDFIFLPSYIDVEPADISLATKFSVNIPIAMPFVSSPMDTVTEGEMAIALARSGGIGVIHRNCSADEEAEEVMKVKRAESFIIRDVLTIGKESTVAEAEKIMKEREISGLPVVEDGRLIGIITGKDVRFSNKEIRTEQAMTKDVVRVSEGITIEEAERLMKDHRIEKLPVTDSEGRLSGLITYRDISLRDKFRNATRDEKGRLRVAAAISPFDMDRAVKLSKIADALVVDVAHFHNQNVINATKKIIDNVSVDVIVGNLGSKEGVLDAVSKLERVGGLRVGIGGGSVCLTTQITRAGSPTLYAVTEAVSALEELGADIPIIADGGIRNSGDIAMSIAFGASSAMMGYVFAGCKESPSPTTLIGDKHYKLHRGMGSESARQKRIVSDRYAKLSKSIAEGTEKWIPYKGYLADVIEELASGVRASMGYAGAKGVKELKGNARVMKVSSSSFARASDMQTIK